ncbi:PorT family protein [Flaviaesturariibacter flavus]|uniref:PorT family protein n=1 Tax=Flaviaesturariibacter flavus TaxID=2502780 RepID=A0A4R1B850_9BACT|nr:porin family protein [Flaviaesturariibacter flavus]TCJ12039.1 PorT family protein [Flaviaesturariibacter flavus]
MLLRILTSLLLLSSLQEAAAQKTEYGFFVGGQATSAGYYLHGHRQATTWLPGAHAGAILRIPFEGNFYFSPSLAYSLKGFDVNLTDTSSNPGINVVGNRLRVHTFELAPLFTLYFASAGTRPFIQFGPAADFAVWGTEDLRLRDGSTSGRTMNFSNDAYGRITASLIVRLGVETRSGFFFNAHYNHGVGSLNQNDFGPSIKHQVAGMSIGKIFSRK